MKDKNLHIPHIGEEQAIENMPSLWQRMKDAFIAGYQKEEERQQSFALEPEPEKEKPILEKILAPETPEPAPENPLKDVQMKVNTDIAGGGELNVQDIEAALAEFNLKSLEGVTTDGKEYQQGNKTTQVARSESHIVTQTPTR